MTLKFTKRRIFQYRTSGALKLYIKQYRLAGKIILFSSLLFCILLLAVIRIEVESCFTHFVLK